MPNEWPGRWTLLRLAVLFEAMLGVLAWAIGWLMGQSPWEHLAWHPGDLARGVAATVPLLAVFALCVRVRWGPLARIRQFCNEILRPFFGASSLLDLALISLVAGVGEEMLFRGVLQAALARWLGAWPGVLAASVLFGLLHLITVTYAVLVMLVGIYLGWLYLAGDNLLVVIVAHALYDFIALVYLVRGPALPNVA